MYKASCEASRHVVCRHVERNPLRANLVKKAEAWPYGSLYRWIQLSIMGAPLGDEQWTEKMADKHGIGAMLRPIGRPRKKQTPIK